MNTLGLLQSKWRYVNFSQVPLGSYPGGISDINLVQVCRWASTDLPYKCILAYGKGIPINVYTILEDNKKCSLLPFRWGSFI